MKHCPVCLQEFPDTQELCPVDGTRLVQSRDWLPGAVIRDKYRILSKLGAGGMGVVYKAQHMRLEELRALKVLSPQLASDPNFLRRFQREAQVVRRVQHPNIVRVDDFDQADDGSPFIAMEYVEGVSLEQVLRSQKGPVTLGRAFRVAIGVAEALAAVHAHHFVHRDVKPANILLARDAGGRELVKLADFGIAVLRDTPATLVALTPQYCAPEQWMDGEGGEVDGRADLFALGAVLYEMLTGRLPFGSKRGQPSPRAEILPPSRLNPTLTARDDLDALVVRLLTHDRDQRYPDAQTLLTDLRVIEARVDESSAASTLPVARVTGERLREPLVGKQTIPDVARQPATVPRGESSHRHARPRLKLIFAFLGFAVLYAALFAALLTRVGPISPQQEVSLMQIGGIAILLLAGVSSKLSIHYLARRAQNRHVRRKGTRGLRDLRWKLVAAAGVIALVALAIYVPGNEKAVELVVRVETDDALQFETQAAVDRLREELRTWEPGARVTLQSPTEFRVEGIPPYQEMGFRRRLNGIDRIFYRSDLSTFAMKSNAMVELREQAVTDTLETIARRVKELGVAEPLVTRYGEHDRILVQLPGGTDVQRAKDIIRTTAKLEFKLVEEGPFADEAAAVQTYVSSVPPDYLQIVSQQTDGLAGYPRTTYYVVPRLTVLTSRDVLTARPTLDENSRPAVSFSLKPESAATFAQFTERNIGRQLAVLVDNRVLSAPRIEGRIGDEGQITGRFTQQEAADLSLLLRSGGLPAKLTFLEERTVR